MNICAFLTKNKMSNHKGCLGAGGPPKRPASAPPKVPQTG